LDAIVFNDICSRRGVSSATLLSSENADIFRRWLYPRAGRLGVGIRAGGACGTSRCTGAAGSSFMTLNGRYRDDAERSVSADVPGGKTEIVPAIAGLRWWILVGIEIGDGARRRFAMV
jgi:hypothetical protein